MKLYGWDDTGPIRGELEAADVQAVDLQCCDLQQLAHALEWEKAFTSFKAAQQALIKEMREGGADPELIDTVKSMKAGYVPVTKDLT